MDLGPSLLLMALFVCCQGFFSGSEIGIVSADPMVLRHKAAKGSRGARLALKLLEKPEWLLSTTLVGTNLSTVAYSTLIADQMIRLFGDAGPIAAVALVVPNSWIFGEIVPKSVFQQKADVITPVIIFPIRFFSIVFTPILWVFSGISRLLTFSVKQDVGKRQTLREEILAMVQMSPVEGEIQQEEKDMIRRLFNFGETTAREVMVPWLDVVVLDREATCGEAARLADREGHHRLPVCSKTDHVEGFLDVLEILGEMPETPIAGFVRKIEFVPDTKSIQDLLKELRQQNTDICIVVDEFGGPRGIVTVEDIVEEVVEEIEDEFDPAGQDPQWLRRVEDRHYLASARVELDDLQEKLGLEIRSDRYSTLGGFLIEQFRTIPHAGQEVWQGNYRFTVEKADPKSIQEVRIRW